MSTESAPTPPYLISAVEQHEVGLWLYTVLDKRLLRSVRTGVNVLTLKISHLVLVRNIVVGSWNTG